MATVTADDIRVLARSELAEPVIAVVHDRVSVVDAVDVDDEAIVYTREDLVADFGEDITDADADILAAGLTAETSPA